MIGNCYLNRYFPFAQIDCPSLPLPCGRPESRCYHKSEASMSHAEADSYCEDNKMTKIEFKNMAEFKVLAQ